MCGPLGTMGCGILAVFGAVFLAAMAILISKDYDYLGEWFDASTEALYENQRSEAVKNCWTVAGIYLAIAVLCGIGMVYHKLRRNI